MNTSSAEKHVRSSCTNWDGMCSTDCRQEELRVSVETDGHPLGLRLYDHKRVPECIKCKPLVINDFFISLLAR